ncbi:unnamed protein product [Paramecium sonneborni]|uniref:Uncharacterized protein n=1 Tax=Paramecium sonneborni TaxID=65129 RepID=A0A8S1N228_9CILI|nr:unnamed protein product [Paramecium sonneborni]
MDSQIQNKRNFIFLTQYWQQIWEHKLQLIEVYSESVKNLSQFGKKVLTRLLLTVNQSILNQFNKKSQKLIKIQWLRQFYHIQVKKQSQILQKARLQIFIGLKIFHIHQQLRILLRNHFYFLSIILVQKIIVGSIDTFQLQNSTHQCYYQSNEFERQIIFFENKSGFGFIKLSFTSILQTWSIQNRLFLNFSLIW